MNAILRVGHFAVKHYFQLYETKCEIAGFGAFSRLGHDFVSQSPPLASPWRDVLGFGSRLVGSAHPRTSRGATPGPVSPARPTLREVAEVTFYEWLQSQPNAYPFLLRLYDKWRIPQSTNKLCKLLRFIDKRDDVHPTTRRLLKQAHREWRNYQRVLSSKPTRDKSRFSFLAATNRGHTEQLMPLVDGSNCIPQERYEEIAELNDFVPPAITHDSPDHFYLAGLKRTGDVTFTVNFDSAENGFDDLWRYWQDSVFEEILNQPPPKPERWERVYRRWGFKHREKCAQCGAGIGWLVKVYGSDLNICGNVGRCIDRLAKQKVTLNNEQE
jgi:hypothetical protein